MQAEVVMTTMLHNKTQWHVVELLASVDTVNEVTTWCYYNIGRKYVEYNTTDGKWARVPPNYKSMRSSNGKYRYTFLFKEAEDATTFALRWL